MSRGLNFYDQLLRRKNQGGKTKCREQQCLKFLRMGNPL